MSWYLVKLRGKLTFTQNCMTLSWILQGKLVFCKETNVLHDSKFISSLSNMKYTLQTVYHSHICIIWRAIVFCFWYWCRHTYGLFPHQIPFTCLQSFIRHSHQTEKWKDTHTHKKPDQIILRLFFKKRHLQSFADLWPTLMGFSIYI
jgi:hypothetical protein